MAGLRVRPVEKRSSIGSSTTSTSTSTSTDTHAAGTGVGVGAAKSTSTAIGKPAGKVKLNPKVKTTAPPAAAAHKTSSVAPKRSMASAAASTAAASVVAVKKQKVKEKEKGKQKSARLASTIAERDHKPTSAGAAAAGGGPAGGADKKAYLLPWEDGFEDRYASDHVREEEQLVACVCGEALDDRDEHRRLIMCDHCCTWQHFPCMELNEEDEPLDYFCHICLPEQHEHLLEKLARGKSAASSKKTKRPSSSRPPAQPVGVAASATKAKAKGEDSVDAKVQPAAEATKAATNGTRSSARKRRASESSEEEVLPVSKRARGLPSTSAAASRAPEASAAQAAKVSPRAQAKVQTPAAADQAGKTHRRQSSDPSRIVVLKVSSRGSASDSVARDHSSRPSKGKKRASQEAMVSIETSWQQPTRSPLGSRVKFDDVKDPSRPSSAAGKSKGKAKLDADLDAIPITTARRIHFVEKSSTPERAVGMDGPAPVRRYRSVTPISAELPAGLAASPRQHDGSPAVAATVVPPNRIVTPVPTALQAQQVRRASSTVPISAGNEVDVVDATPTTTRTTTVDVAINEPSSAVSADADRSATKDEIATSFSQAAFDLHVANAGNVDVMKKSAENEKSLANESEQVDTRPSVSAEAEHEPTAPQQELSKGKSGDTGKVDASSIISGKRARKPSAKALQSLSEISPMAEAEVDEDAVAAHTRASSRRGSTASTASAKSAPTSSAVKLAAKSTRRSLSPAVRMKRSPSQLSASSTVAQAPPQAQAQTQTPIRATPSTATAVSSAPAALNGSADFSIERDRRPYQGRLDELDNESVLDGKRQRKLTFKAAKPTSASANRHSSGGDGGGGEFAVPTKPAHALDGFRHATKPGHVSIASLYYDTPEEAAAAAAAKFREAGFVLVDGKVHLLSNGEWKAPLRHDNPTSQV